MIAIHLSSGPQVAGHPTGFGNPTWLATHAPPTVNASCVQVRPRIMDALNEMLKGSLCWVVWIDQVAYQSSSSQSTAAGKPFAASPGHAICIAWKSISCLARWGACMAFCVRLGHVQYIVSRITRHAQLPGNVLCLCMGNMYLTRRMQARPCLSSGVS